MTRVLRGLLAVAMFGTLTAGSVRAEQVSGHETLNQAAEIQARLQKDPDLKNNHIDVTVDNGIATLKGTVDTDNEKAQAARLSMIKGIVGVQNQLDVGSVGVKQTFSDSAITAKIKAKMGEHRMASFTDVSVTTNNGVVTLTGSVPSEQARAEALQAARSADGVTRVENDLTIAPKK
jgi:hyperosmotically inducible periplasmic protein